jgi:hypothetical protein
VFTRSVPDTSEKKEEEKTKINSPNRDLNETKPKEIRLPEKYTSCGIFLYLNK